MMNRLDRSDIYLTSLDRSHKDPRNNLRDLSTLKRQDVPDYLTRVLSKYFDPEPKDPLKRIQYKIRKLREKHAQDINSDGEPETIVIYNLDENEI